MLDDTTYSSNAAPSGPAMLGLHLRAAVLEAEEAETQTATLDRARARDQLRLRLGQLVDQRRDDLTAALGGARAEALATLDAARQEAEVILEAATLVAASVAARPAPRPPEATGTARLPSRAAVAMLGLQLRAAQRDAEDAECREHVQREQAEPALAARRRSQQRRDEMDAELAIARREAEAVLEAGQRQAAAIAASALAVVAARPTADLGHQPVEAVAPEVVEVEVAAPEVVAPEVVAPEVVEEPALLQAPEPVIELEPEAITEPIVEPAPAAVEEVASELTAEPVVRSVFEPMQQMPLVQPVQFAPQLPVNVVIDAEAFARVFAAVIASALEERQPVWAPTAQMFSALPVAPPAPVKQSFWSHAKHVDVLLLSAAMVIVLVVLAAWLV